MDYEDIIKLEEQSPIYSTGNNFNQYKNCMASFYDHDSQIQHKQQQQEVHFTDNLSFQKAIDYVQNYIDIIDTPLQDILICFDRLQCADNLDRMTLRKKILKRKNLMKRFRAKNRQPKIICPYQKFSSPNTLTGAETEAEIKKKRNRVSAQISRDRKKQYFKELQQKNQKLEEQIIRARLENQKLKRQIQDSTEKPKNRVFSQTTNNKLTKLLIFLGIICLIGMLKETFFSTKENLSKLQMSTKIDDFNQFSSIHQSKMIEQGQRKVAEFLQEPELQQELLSTEESKVSFEIDQPPQSSKKHRFFSNLIERLTDMKQIIERKNIQL